jgi:hypothetical protein
MTNNTTNETTIDPAAQEYLDYAKDNWRDAVILKTIAAVIENQWKAIIVGQGKGQIKNNKQTTGYIEALRDVHRMLINILPEDAFNNDDIEDLLPDLAEEIANDAAVSDTTTNV